jgi:hypothetical protein
VGFGRKSGLIYPTCPKKRRPRGRPEIGAQIVSFKFLNSALTGDSSRSSGGRAEGAIRHIGAIKWRKTLLKSAAWLIFDPAPHQRQPPWTTAKDLSVTFP